MRMKPLNHKERRKAIWKFIGSLIPFLITMPLFIYVFCFTSDKHSEYIENRYEIKKKSYREQAIYGVRVDTIMSRIDEISRGQKKDYEYKEIQWQLNNTIQNSLDEISRIEEVDPYKDIFDGSREVLSVVDSIYNVQSDLVPAKRQLIKLTRKYNDSKRLSLSQ